MHDKVIIKDIANALQVATIPLNVAALPVKGLERFTMNCVNFLRLPVYALTQQRRLYAPTTF